MLKLKSPHLISHAAIIIFASSQLNFFALLKRALVLQIHVIEDSVHYHHQAGGPAHLHLHSCSFSGALELGCSEFAAWLRQLDRDRSYGGSDWHICVYRVVAIVLSPNDNSTETFTYKLLTINN